MDYVITKDHILRAIVVKYNDINGGILIPDKNPAELKYVEKTLPDGTTDQYLMLFENHNGITEPLRLVLFQDHKFIDLETCEEMFELPTEGDYIAGEIYKDTYYILECMKCEVSDELLLYATKVYEKFIEKQELIKEKKLIPFPKKRIY